MSYGTDLELLQLDPLFKSMHIIIYDVLITDQDHHLQTPRKPLMILLPCALRYAVVNACQIRVAALIEHEPLKLGFMKCR